MKPNGGGRTAESVKAAMDEIQRQEQKRKQEQSPVHQTRGPTVQTPAQTATVHRTRENALTPDQIRKRSEERNRAARNARAYTDQELVNRMRRANQTTAARQAEYESIRGELETAYSAAEEQRRRLELLNGRLRSQSGLARYEEMRQEYEASLTALEEIRARADSAYSSYEREYERFSSLNSEYENRRNAYAEWKGSLRTGLTENEAHDLNRELEARKADRRNLEETVITSNGGVWTPGAARMRDEYDRRIAEIEGQLAGSAFADRDTARQRAEEITAQINELQRKNRQLTLLGQQQAAMGVANPFEEQMAKNRAQVAALEKQLEKVKASETAAQEEIRWADYFRYADKMEEADFAPISQYRPTEQDGGKTYGDLTYDYINRDRGARDAMYKLHGSGNIWMEQMNDQEIAVYNYLYAKEGKESAQTYLEHIKQDLTRRERERVETGMAEDAKKHPWIMTGISAMLAPTKAIGAVGQSMDMLRTGRVDENAGYNLSSQVSNSIREEVSKKWGPVGSWAYQTGMSLLDNYVNRTVGMNSEIALAIMGSGAVADKTIEAKDRGLSDEQAYKLGVAAGLAEIVTEKISLDALLDMTDMGKNAWGYIWKNIRAEAGEEMASDLINLAADIIVSKDRSQWQQSIESYRQQGMSREEAFARAVGDQAISTALSGLGGGLSGGIMAGGNVILNGGKSPEAEQEVPKAPQQPAQVNQPRTKEALIAQAKRYPPTPENNALVERLEQADSFEQAKGIHDAVYPEPGAELRAEAESAGVDLGNSQQIRSFRDSTVAAMESNLTTEAQKEQIRRLKEAKTDLQITGILAGASQTQIDIAQRMADILGKRVLFEYEGDRSVNGRYQRSRDSIWINANSRNPVAQIIGHELTHSIEKAGHYADLRKLVQSRILNTGGDLAKLRREIQSRYKKKGVELSDGEADLEVIAEYVEKNLLTDENAIRQMVADDRGLARRVLDWLEGLAAKFTGSRSRWAEHQFVLKARDAYRAALQESYGIHERGRIREAKMDAWRRGDDATGDALYEEEYAGDGSMESLLEDENQWSIGDENKPAAETRLQMRELSEEEDAHLRSKLTAFEEDPANRDVMAMIGRMDEVLESGSAREYKRLEKEARKLGLLDRIEQYRNLSNEYGDAYWAAVMGDRLDQSRSTDAETDEEPGQADALQEEQNTGGEVFEETDPRFWEDGEAVQQEQTETAPPRQEPQEQPDPVETLSRKAEESLRDAERALVNQVAKSLSVPWKAKRDFLKPIVRQISGEVLRSGSVSRETVGRLFETAWEQGRVVDEEFYNQYREVKDRLRTQPVTLSQTDRGDIPDYEGFKKDARYALRIKDEGGTPVDSFWGELREMAPELFPDHITHPADQLQRMLEVARDIRKVEYNLDQVYSGDPDFKRWARNDFEAAIDDAVAELRKVSRYEDDRQAQKKEEAHSDLTQEEVTALYPKLKDARRAYDRAVAKNLLTEEDRKQVGRLLRGVITLDQLKPGRDNVSGIRAVYEAKVEYEKLAKPIRQWNASRKAQLMQQAAELTEGAAWWKDKWMGILYSRETMERNIRDIVPDKELAQRIIDTYFTPVHKAAADANRLKNKYRDRIRALNLSTKAEKGKVSEAYAVQLLGEAEDNIRVMENSRGRIKTRDGKTVEEWRETIRQMWEENPQLDQQKIRSAVAQFRKIYDELFEQMNEARIRNGYEPVNYRQGYFPHFQANDEEGIMAQFGKALGIRTEVTALPTSINGLTRTFRPGIRWMGNALERKGFDTVYDAVEGFDRYIEGVADVICQTDNIQRLRALEAQARYNSTDEGIREKIDGIRKRTDLSDEDKEKMIRYEWENAKFALSNFVVELEEYTNLLANKKSRADRNMEQAMGRDMYNLVKAWESRVAANMVAVNPGSWITNFIPLQQGAATLDRGMILQGMIDTLKAIKNDDGFVDTSSFLINRRGSDPLVRTGGQKVSAFMSRPMERIDSFTADSLVRARFRQNVKRGMSDAAAIEEADQWAAGVMADRSKGATPTLFNRNNPLTKMFTQFQLEVNNQLSYIFKDMPREAEELGKALAVMLFKFLIGAYLINDTYEWINGRRPAFDPLGILLDFGGDLFGFDVPNVIEFITGKDRDFREEKKGAPKALGNLGQNVLESLPFTSALNVLGLDIDAGRVPVASALPDLNALVNAATNSEWSRERRWDTFKDELDNFATSTLLPFGGSQVKKVIQGLKAVRDHGSYSINTDGEEQLQYPVHYSNGMEMLLAYAKAMTFGKSSFDTAQEWVDSGFSGLSAKQTAAYKAMVAAGEDNEKAYELIMEIKGAEKSDEQSKSENQRRILRESGVSGQSKEILYRTMASDKEVALMDSLQELGADMEAVTDVLMQIKDAPKTDELSQSENQRRILREAGLPQENKAVIYYQLMASDAELALMDSLNETDADMGEVADVLMQIKDAGSTNEKRAAILGSGLKEKEKIAIYTDRISDKKGELIQSFDDAGMDFDEFLTVQNMYAEIDAMDAKTGQKATAFSSWINKQGYSEAQETLIRENFRYWMQTPAEATYYDRAVEYGMTDEAARELADTLITLEPEEGKDSVDTVQRWRAACGISTDPEVQMDALRTVLKEDSVNYGKLETAYRYGIEPLAFVHLKEILPQFDANGNGSYTNAEVKAAIDSMSSSGLVLPGGDGTIFFLTLAQKAALWQIYSTSSSAKNNPYDTDVGWEIIEARKAE